MKRVRKVLGYAWAVAALPVVLAAFMGMNFWAGALARGTGVVISPWFTGGGVARTIDRGAWRMRVHRPVFDGLFSEQKEGFVQVDFVVPAAADSIGAGPAGADSTRAVGAAAPPGPAAAVLPASIEEDVDFDADGRADFRLAITTGTAAATVTPLSPRVLGLRESFRLDDGVGARVGLKNMK